MSITSDLEQILSARYGKDVRQAIHDSIEEGYNIAVQAQGTAETSADSAEAYANAALASEQNAQDYMELAEQYKNEAFSGTPTGYADLVAKVNSIYRQTATSYNVVGTSEGSALAHTIYGMSEQDGTPTPSVPVDIDSAVANFNCVGKNLIPYPYYRQSGYTHNGMTGTYDDSGIITINKEVGSAIAYFALYLGNKMLYPNTRYKLSMILENANRVSVYISHNNIDIAAIRNKASGNYEYTFTTPNELLGTTQMSLYFGAADAETNCKVKVMLTLADADQTYEPYQHTDVTTNLTLRAIEVQSTDDYNLERDGKYYIADTLDWDEDEGYSITRRIKEAVVDGSNVKATYYQQTTLNGVDVKQINLTDTANDVIKKIGAYVLSNILESVTYSARKVNSILVANNDGIIASYYDTDMPFSSITTFNTWAQNNPFIINYVLATPTTEPITSEQAQALLSLKTYDEATSISATGDIEPSLDLEYSKDRNTALALTGHNLAFKNALKLNDINTALIELGGN